jgi:hypothetical protein
MVGLCRSPSTQTDTGRYYPHPALQHDNQCSPMVKIMPSLTDEMEYLHEKIMQVIPLLGVAFYCNGGYNALRASVLVCLL